MSGSTVQLGDVARFVRGINFKPDDVVPLETEDAIACFRTKNVQAQVDLDDVWGVPRSFVKRDEQLVCRGDLLVSTANSWNLVGKCCWVPELPWPATLGGFISALRPDPVRIDPRFLYWWFSYDKTQAVVRSFGRRTTSISNLSLEQCLAMPLPLPPLPEQRRIAAILDKADALRAKRRAALAELDGLAQSIFLDMFGDPVANPKQWPTTKLASLGTLDRGVSKHRPRNAPELLGGTHPLIQTGDVANSDGYIRQHQSTYSDLGLRQSKKWPAGTLCITIAANIAKTAILTFDACFPDSVVGFRADDVATTEFVRAWLSFLQKSLEDSAPESAQKNINLAILRDLDVIAPPKSLQAEFSKRIASIELMKALHRDHLAEVGALFASLQHRAFRGEL